MGRNRVNKAVFLWLACGRRLRTNLTCKTWLKVSKTGIVKNTAHEEQKLLFVISWMAPVSGKPFFLRKKWCKLLCLEVDAWDFLDHGWECWAPCWFSVDDELPVPIHMLLSVPDFSHLLWRVTISACQLSSSLKNTFLIYFCGSLPWFWGGDPDMAIQQTKSSQKLSQVSGTLFSGWQKDQRSCSLEWNSAKCCPSCPAAWQALERTLWFKGFLFPAGAARLCSAKSVSRNG